ncbi:MAG TPA: tetratricopeptide repeat protein [Verrucomicrobiae bacterium]
MAEIALNQLPLDVRRLHAKAAEAAQRENHDYAIALFAQILEKNPGCLEVRHQLRAAQQAKAGTATTGFFKKMLSGAGSSPLIAKAKMAAGKNPGEAMALAEQVLNTDPGNLMAHRIILDAAQALELHETHLFTLQCMAVAAPSDRSVIMEYAQAVSDMRAEASLAEKLLNDLIRKSDYDADLLQLQKNLSAHKTMQEGGYDQIESGEASYRDILRNKEEAVSLEQENKVQKSDDVAERLIGEYEARLQKEPDNLKMLRSLAELYTQKNRHDEALAIYQRIKASELGKDSSLDRAIAETTSRKYDHAIKQLDESSPEAAAQRAQIAAEKLTFQITECQKRVEKYPTDLSFRYELGVLYFQAGKITEAIAEFQKAQQNPHKRISAMSYLAQCFAKRGMNDSAIRTLQNAIKEKPVLDDEKKDLIYNLGCVFDKTGKKAEAIEQFLIIYESDVSYRDVGAKVDAHYAAQG